MKKKEPIAYILNNLAVIYQVYVDAGKKAKPAYDALKAVIPEFENEIEYNTFNSRIKPIMDTYEFLESCTRREPEKQADLKQEVKRLNTIISNLYDDLQEVNTGVNVEMNKQVNEVNMNEVIQRLERLEKAVFQSEVNQVNIGVNEVNSDKVNQVNLFEDKQVNVKSEKLKVGKWNIVKRGNAYRAYRNFGKVKGTAAVYVGKVFTSEIAIAKITAAGHPID